jgi:hypothetical protein
MRRSALRVSATIASAIAVLALPACSGSDDDADGSDATSTSAESSDASPTDESTSSDEPTVDSVTGSGYSIAVPTGWEDVTELAKQSSSQADIAVAEPQTEGEFRTNFNVVSPSPLPDGVSDDELAEQAATELESVTKSEVTPLDATVDFDGAKALGQTSKTTTQGYNIAITLYVLVHEDQIFATTLTYDEKRADEAMDTLAEIADSWTWDVS